MRILKDKRGMSYVLVCVVVLIASMLIYVGLEYNSAIFAVKMQKQEVSVRLDKVIADTLKESIEDGTSISAEQLEQRAYEALGFENINTQIRDGDGYSMSRPSFFIITGTDISVTAEYKLTVPMRLLDAEVIDITVPVKVSAKYYERN